MGGLRYIDGPFSVTVILRECRLVTIVINESTKQQTSLTTMTFLGPSNSARRVFLALIPALIAGYLFFFILDMVFGDLGLTANYVIQFKARTKQTGKWVSLARGVFSKYIFFWPLLVVFFCAASLLGLLLLLFDILRILYLGFATNPWKRYQDKQALQLDATEIEDLLNHKGFAKIDIDWDSGVQEVWRSLNEEVQATLVFGRLIQSRTGGAMFVLAADTGKPYTGVWARPPSSGKPGRGGHAKPEPANPRPESPQSDIVDGTVGKDDERATGE